MNIVDDEPAKGIGWLPVHAAALGAPTLQNGVWYGWAGVHADEDQYDVRYEASENDDGDAEHTFVQER